MKWIDADGLKKVHEGGMLRFVLFRGVFFWGFFTAACYTFIGALMGQDGLTETAQSALIWFPVGGLIWGVCMWFYLEALYNRNLDSQDKG